MTGLWLPVLTGGVGVDGIQQVYALVMGEFYPMNPSSVPTINTYALDSAYTFNSAGDAIAQRVRVQRAVTLAAIYFSISSVTGTAANVNDLDFELRNDDGSDLTPNRVSPTLHTSGSMNPNADASFVGWHKIDPADFAMTKGVTYWAIMADADGGAVDFATLSRGEGQAAFEVFKHKAGVHDTTNGFSSNAIARGESSLIVLEFTDGSVNGRSTILGSAATSSTNRKGMYIGGVTGPLSIYGAFCYSTGSVNISGIELYDSGTLPGGTPLRSGTDILRSTLGTRIGAALSSPYTLEAATVYRLVFTFSAAFTEPRKLGFGANANGHGAVLKKARFGGGDWYYAEANGTTDWSNDDQNVMPHMPVLIEDTVATATVAPVISRRRTVR